MTGTIGKSHNVCKVQSRAKRTQAVRSASLQSAVSKAVAHTADSGSRGQSVTKLRTIPEAAELFGTSTRTVRRLIDSGALPVYRLGRLVRISDRDIAAFLAANHSALNVF